MTGALTPSQTERERERAGIELARELCYRRTEERKKKKKKKKKLPFLFCLLKFWRTRHILITYIITPAHIALLVLRTPGNFKHAI